MQLGNGEAAPGTGLDVEEGAWRGSSVGAWERYGGTRGRLRDRRGGEAAGAWLRRRLLADGVAQSSTSGKVAPAAAAWGRGRQLGGRWRWQLGVDAVDGEPAATGFGNRRGGRLREARWPAGPAQPGRARGSAQKKVTRWSSARPGWRQSA
jgi:hypothetical protein